MMQLVTKPTRDHAHIHALYIEVSHCVLFYGSETL